MEHFSLNFYGNKSNYAFLASSTIIILVNAVLVTASVLTLMLKFNLNVDFF
jgi:hypothetical protein